MKKILTIVVPLVMLLAVGSVGMAAEEGDQELNQDLNENLLGNSGDAGRDRGDNQDLDNDDNPLDDDVELNDTTNRDTRALANKRGRQPRRGQTASDLSDVQQYWGDHGSGQSQDEFPDEDEDDDVTTTGP